MKRQRRQGMAHIGSGIPVKFAPHDLAEPRPVTGPDTPSGVSGAGQAAAGEIIGYKIGDQLYHPSDVVIIRRRDQP